MKTYEETTEWLFEQFPSYQNQGAGAYKPDLHTISKLLKALGNPHSGLQCIHVAGTNGKGSTSHMIASILMELGYKVGVFSSPHLKDFRERIRINGSMIPQTAVVNWVNHKLPTLNLDYSPSFFELSFAIAVDYFNEQNCDFCILEAGMGGRLDATNIISPLVSVITNIGLDHKQFLGNTRKEIAREKAGIIKPGVPVVIYEKDVETQEVFESVAKEKNSTIYWVQQGVSYKTDLPGIFQQANAATAVATIHELEKANAITPAQKAIQQGLQKVKINTSFQGRMEKLSDAPQTFLDGAHNIEGIKALLENFQDLKDTSLHIIYGASNDKELENIFTLFPENSRLYFTSFANPRSFSIEELQERSEHLLQKRTFFSNPLEALKSAQTTAKEKDTILIFGSLFLVSDFF